MVRVLTVIGTRPEAIKMAPVIRALNRRPDRIESIVCTTAQHREMLDQVLHLFNIEPHIDLKLMRPGQSLSEITARVTLGMTEVLKRERPNCVLIQGDTSTVMATALSAFYERIPVGHVEAGLRTSTLYDPFPEEMNRRFVSMVATLHFAPTETACQALLAENIPKANIFLTGNPVVDALLWVVDQKPSDDTLSLFSQLNISFPEKGGKNPTLSSNSGKLLLVTAHRRENFGAPLESICHGLRRIVERNPHLRLVYPVHLNPRVRETVYRILRGHERIILINPLSYETFVHLMKASNFILTDSGGVQEEAPVLGKPVLVMRQETERPEGVVEGLVKVIGTEADRLVFETERLLNDPEEYRRMALGGSLYGDGHAADRIVQILFDRYA